MGEKKGPDGRDDFGGIGLLRAALVLFVVALAHPWQALREVLAVSRGAAGRALRLALAPFALVAVHFWARHRDRRPSFEDFLRGRREEGIAE